jgi:adenylate cyclase
MAASLGALTARTEIPLLIAFADLTRFQVTCERTPDAEMAALLDELYVRVAERVAGAGGVVVKYMGDAALVVFPEERASDGAVALLALKEETDAWLRGRGLDCRLIVKAHFGPAVAGPFGPRESRRFDVIGSAVNLAATLETRSFALSAEAFRRLAPDARKRFKKHTPPITYIPLDGPRP